MHTGCKDHTACTHRASAAQGRGDGSPPTEVQDGVGGEHAQDDEGSGHGHCHVLRRVGPEHVRVHGSPEGQEAADACGRERGVSRGSRGRWKGSGLRKVCREGLLFPASCISLPTLNTPTVLPSWSLWVTHHLPSSLHYHPVIFRVSAWRTRPCPAQPPSPLLGPSLTSPRSIFSLPVCLLHLMSPGGRGTLFAALVPGYGCRWPLRLHHSRNNTQFFLALTSQHFFQWSSLSPTHPRSRCCFLAPTNICSKP